MKAENILSLPVFPNTCSSLLKKHLTQSVWDSLADQCTASGFTFRQAVRSGIEQVDSGVGVYAGDAESYDLFEPLLGPIIQDYHGSAGPHPKTDFSVDKLPDVSSSASEKVLSTRIRVGRNLADFPLGAAISQDQRQAVEKRICRAFEDIPESMQGQYFSLGDMLPERNAELIARHLLFKNEDRFMASGNLMRDWPDGRGLYLSRDERFSVWVNEEDQMRIIAMQPGGDIKAVFALLADGVTAISKQLTFLFSDKLGYLASCPTNLGTSMRASVHMNLAELGKDEAKLKRIAEEIGLQVRGLHGEHSATEGTTYDISNRMRLGVTEVAAVSHLIDGINHLAEFDDKQQS